MKILNKISAVIVTVVFMFGLAGPTPAYAVTATAPDLGSAATFSVMAGSSMTADASGATISGDLGVSPGNTKTGTWTHTGGTDYLAGATAATAMANAVTAWTNMSAANLPGGTTWLVTNLNPAAGVWTANSSATFDGTLTLDGSATDVWIFQITDSLTFTGTINLTGGAQACNVFWRIAQDATILRGVDANNKFVGTLIAGNAVSLVDGVTVNGRIIARDAALTTAGVTTITTPTCAGGGSAFKYSSEGTINVVKSVVNDNGGAKTVADFPLFVGGTSVVSGVTNSFHAPFYSYAITETSNPNYTQTFSGDCDSNGLLNLNPNDIKFCIITNDDIGPSVVVPPVPPLIDVVKVPSPLALPAGPGPVTYTYTLRNIGTVPVTNVTMVGDTCSPIILASGDTNADAKLDVNETWVYRCSTTLSQTHTNTVTATGWANGISAIDIASAMVIVGDPVVPPLIHITKVPNPLALFAGGGTVVYTKKVTNPGTVALSNVRVTDDKCGPVNYISGDNNGNSKLDPIETWTYTCQTKLTKTTTNTAIASGEANDLTARDFAIATVVVATAVPGLPNSGIAPDDGNIKLNISILAGLFAISVFFYFTKRKQTSV